MIKKEVLSKVLGRNILYCDTSTININQIDYSMEFDTSEYHGNRTINIYELVYKCKEWALENGYFSITMFRADGLFSCDIGPTSSESFDRWEECFIEETEAQSVFKACEWIIAEQNL